MKLNWSDTQEERWQALLQADLLNQLKESDKPEFEKLTELRTAMLGPGPEERFQSAQSLRHTNRLIRELREALAKSQDVTS